MQYPTDCQASSSQSTLALGSLTAIQMITALHYGEGAAVAFARMAGGWQECGAMLVKDVPTKWAGIEGHLIRDSYFSLASTFEQQRAPGLSALGLPLWSRRAECLRWINVIAVDLDQHSSSNFSVGALLESFYTELELQSIPSPNFISFSGRGLWALWQLKDQANPSQPVRAFADKRHLAQRINVALIKKFASLGADRCATDAARVMRLPDSVNSKALPENSLVRFFRTSHGAYTLPELADVLGVRARKLSLPGESRPKQRAKQLAAAMRWRHPLDGFRALWKMRGKFSLGTRHYAIYIYAMLLRKNRATPGQVLTACARLAESMTPALNVADVKRAIVASQKAIRYNVSNTRLAEMLKITANERAALSRWFRPEAKPKSAQIAERRTLITQEVDNAPEGISTRRLVGLLAEKHGINLSRFTAARDLRSISGAFPQLIEPRVSLCISGKNAPLVTETKFAATKAVQTHEKGSSRDSQQGSSHSMADNGSRGLL